MVKMARKYFVETAIPYVESVSGVPFSKWCGAGGLARASQGCSFHFLHIFNLLRKRHLYECDHRVAVSTFFIVF
jgi:hypothetical protein